MQRRLILLLLITQAWALVQAPRLQAQVERQDIPRPTFRSSAHLIVQTVSVKDKKNRPVEGLTVKDFLVTEDGVTQDIAFVEYQSLDASPELSSPAAPARSAAAVTAVAPDSVPAPRADDRTYRGRRLLILYFDLYNMPFVDQANVYSAADDFITNRMTPVDIMAVMAFKGGRVRLEQDFSDDRGALREVIQRLMTEADESNGGLGGGWNSGSAFGEDDDTFNLFATDRQLSALQRAVRDLGPLPEVKTLIYFGSGLRLNGADNQAQLRATVNAAVRANVTINPIDTRGLTASPPLGDASRPSPGGIGLFSGATMQAAITKQQQAQDTFYALAKDTGGRAMFDNNDLALGITQAAAAVTGYYMIGYYSSHDARDGRYRRVKVTLTSALDAELSYRSGYYGEKDYAKFNATEREHQLEEALRLEDPITDIPMAMEVNYFQLNRAEYYVPVSVRMPGSELTRPQANRSSRAQIDMIGEIKDEHGVTIQNAKDKLEFKLDAAAAIDVSRRAIQYEAGFTLLPGSYVIKVLARDTTTGRIGTFQKSFTVPNLEREQVRLPISSVVLTSQRLTRAEALFNVRQKVVSEGANPLVYEGRQLIPSVTRTFSAGRPLFVYLQAYQRGGTETQPLVAFVTLYRDGVKAFETESFVFSDTWTANSKAVPIRINVSLTDLQPGSYECQITVLDPIASRASFWRAPIQLVR